MGDALSSFCGLLCPEDHGGGGLLISQQRQMRWYNPSLGDFEWREVPLGDEEAISLLEGYPDAHIHAEVYQEWRDLGASIMSALIRAGEAAKKERGDTEPSA